MQLNKFINENEYKISKVNSYDGTINIIVTPKKRNCKVCKKVFVTNNTEYLSWKTKDDYRVFGWFCRKHYYKAKKLIKECK
tara:strand:+ start:199 stop:441 length:243 start_codon:yes stop_codon:yes gene_type:complete